MIELKPIRETKSDYDAIEEKIKELFKKEVYEPIIAELTGKKKIKNAKLDLLEALRSGRLTFHRGQFSGRFNATLSKELKALGAHWNPVWKTFSIPYAELPSTIKSAISASSFAFSQKLEKIDRKLASIVPAQLAEKLKLQHLFDQTLWKVEKDFQESVKNITIAPKLTSQQAKRIADEWQNNMDKWIQNFTEKEIKELRTKIRSSFFAGNRYETAVKVIQSSYGVTERKARFLARQETALLMAKHKEVKYQEAGVHEYKWRAVVGTPKHPTRKRHKHLSTLSDKGTIFRFDDPPNTAEIPGQDSRPTHEGPANFFNNPGEDYNCRCTAIPIVRFKK